MSKNKNNDSGNGRDKDKKGEVIDFAKTLAERDKLRREAAKRAKRTKRGRSKNYSVPNSEPFFNFGNIPLFTRILAAGFILVHLPLYMLLDDGERLRILFTFGFVPGTLTGTFEWSIFALISPVAHLFIHGSWMHLVFNTVMAVVFGVFTEREYGSKHMLAFFFLSGILGALAFFIFNPFSTYPVVGASGAISGLFAITFLTMLQHGQLGAIGSKGPLPLILFWALLLTGMGLLGGNIAWQAHLGGFLSGVGLFYAMRRGYL